MSTTINCYSCSRKRFQRLLYTDDLTGSWRDLNSKNKETGTCSYFIARDAKGIMSCIKLITNQALTARLDGDQIGGGNEWGGEGDDGNYGCA